MTQMEAFLLLILSGCVSRALARDTRFVNFFPMHRTELIKTRDTACAELFARKQAGDQVCHPLLNCMLENTSEAVKNDIAGAVVALGLMPSLLTFLGSSTTEIALLAKRRPLLALLIASGSPSVSPVRTFDYPNPVEKLKIREGGLALPYFSPFQAAFVSMVEYALVLGAVANVYTAAFYAGRWTINMVDCDTDFYAIVWAVLTIPLHICGMWCLALRTETKNDNKARRRDGWKSVGLRWLRHEATPCIVHEKLHLVQKPETYLFVVVSWWMATYTAVHVLYGTVTFSTLQFLGWSSRLLILRLIPGLLMEG